MTSVCVASHPSEPTLRTQQSWLRAQTMTRQRGVRAEASARVREAKAAVTKDEQLAVDLDEQEAKESHKSDRVYLEELDDQEGGCWSQVASSWMLFSLGSGQFVDARSARCPAQLTTGVSQPRLYSVLLRIPVRLRATAVARIQPVITKPSTTYASKSCANQYSR